MATSPASQPSTPIISEHHDGTLLESLSSLSPPRAKLFFSIGISKKGCDSIVYNGFQFQTMLKNCPPGEQESALETGDDALFVAACGKARSVSFGIADGVGGWAAKGVNAGLVSRSLMKNCKEYLQFNSFELRSTLWQAYERTFADPDIEAGSSTATLATLSFFPEDPSNLHVRTLNLGDSGYRVYDSFGRQTRKSFDQNHETDAPFQLAVLKNDFLALQDEVCHDSPNEALEECFVLGAQSHYNCCDGSTMILASDGLYSNVSDEELSELVQEWNRDFTGCYPSTTHLANTLMARAKAGPIMDDITIIVAHVIAA